MKTEDSECWLKKELDEKIFINPLDYNNHYKKVMRTEYKDLFVRKFPIIRLCFHHKHGKQHHEAFYMWEKNRLKFMQWYNKQRFKRKKTGDMNVIINYTITPEEYYKDKGER